MQSLVVSTLPGGVSKTVENLGEVLRGGVFTGEIENAKVAVKGVKNGWQREMGLWQRATEEGGCTGLVEMMACTWDPRLQMGFLVTPVYKGDLMDLLMNGDPSVVDLRRVFLGALEGLEFMHDICKWYHGDLKPENILLNGRGEGVLADFGFAGSLDNACRIIGTVGYAATELALRPDTFQNLRQRCLDLGRTVKLHPHDQKTGAAVRRVLKVLREEDFAFLPEKPDMGAADMWALGVSLYSSLFDHAPWQIAVHIDPRCYAFLKISLESTDPCAPIDVLSPDGQTAEEELKSRIRGRGGDDMHVALAVERMLPLVRTCLSVNGHKRPPARAAIAWLNESP